jgi:hypothetical protein
MACCMYIVEKNLKLRRILFKEQLDFGLRRT